MDSFAETLAKERNRLSAERDSLIAKVEEIHEQLDAIERELKAIDAYEAAKNPQPKQARKTTTTTRRGGVRDKVLEIIKANPSTSAEVRAALDIKEDDKAGAQSVANALSALKRAGKLTTNSNGSYEALT